MKITSGALFWMLIEPKVRLGCVNCKSRPGLELSTTWAKVLWLSRFIRIHVLNMFLGILIVAGLGCFMFEAASGAESWRQAQAGYQFEFPRDHSSHPEFKIEWWYYTGNLRTSNARHFGFQLTFFRVGVQSRSKNPSRWVVRDLFMSHLALSDIQSGRFHFAERLNRAGPGWAGASTDTYRVWNGQWETRLQKTGRHELRARDRSFGIELDLDPGRAIVPHGTAGISQKGARKGNSTHYYSLPRMPTQGSVWLEDQRFEVSGLSWMDHEFGTSFLEPKQTGWDWFAIQLEDGLDLMCFQLRRSDGQLDPHSSGTLIEASGKLRSLRSTDFFLQPVETWHSPHSGATYPVVWNVSIPSELLNLKIRAVLFDQELRTERSTNVTYWEGAVEISGSRDGRPVVGKGYLEMTGYSGEPMSEFLR